ncbi:MAG: hypothetical protein GX638_07805 [Crenarchaeota archaeon]|nr:hypothetical protein [Thermoproteota archaeon]
MYTIVDRKKWQKGFSDDRKFEDVFESENFEFINGELQYNNPIVIETPTQLKKPRTFYKSTNFGLARTTSYDSFDDFDELSDFPVVFVASSSAVVPCVEVVEPRIQELEVQDLAMRKDQFNEHVMQGLESFLQLSGRFIRDVFAQSLKTQQPIDIKLANNIRECYRDTCNIRKMIKDDKINTREFEILVKRTIKRSVDIGIFADSGKSITHNSEVSQTHKKTTNWLIDFMMNGSSSYHYR